MVSLKKSFSLVVCDHPNQDLGVESTFLSDVVEEGVQITPVPPLLPPPLSRGHLAFGTTDEYDRPGRAFGDETPPPSLDLLLLFAVFGGCSKFRPRTPDPLPPRLEIGHVACKCGWRWHSSHFLRFL